MATFTLTQEEYEALISLARQGAELISQDKVRSLEAFLKNIETNNNITRSLVVVKWQEQDAQLPPGTTFPDNWPPELTETIELVTRPVAKVDVEAVIAQKAKNPTNILVTRDPAGITGLTPIDDFFIT